MDAELRNTLEICLLAATVGLTWRTLKRQEATHKLQEETYKLQQATYKLTELIYKRDEAYHAVLTARSSACFKRPIHYCEPMILELRNCSKFPVAISVQIISNGFCIHYDRGEIHPAQVYGRICPQQVLVPPDKCFTQSFRLHVVKPRPATASVGIVVNGNIVGGFVYKYDVWNECYQHIPSPPPPASKMLMG